MDRILKRLLKHYEECQGYRNELIEHNADWLKVADAGTRLHAIEECIQIVKSEMEVGDEQIN